MESRELLEHSEAEQLRPITIREQRAAFRLYLVPITACGTPTSPGHASLSTTLRYMHLVPGATTLAVEALEHFDESRGRIGAGPSGQNEAQNEERPADSVCGPT